MCATTQLSPIPVKSLEIVIKSEKRNEGGNFTMRSKRSGKDFTYKIRRSEFQGKWYTHVYVERQYLSFLHLGHYINGLITKHGQQVDSDTAQGIAWLLRQVESSNLDKIDQQVDLFHTGSCLKCGRELTDADSIEIGLGPVCRSTK